MSYFKKCLTYFMPAAAQGRIMPVVVLSSVRRAVVLRLVGLCVLLFTLWSQVTCSGNPDEDDCRLCQYNHKLYPVILLLGLSLEALKQ